MLRRTAMRIRIHDAILDNSTLDEIPGSHRKRAENRRDPNSDHHLALG